MYYIIENLSILIYLLKNLIDENKTLMKTFFNKDKAILIKFKHIFH